MAAADPFSDLDCVGRSLLALFDQLPDVFLFVKGRDHRFRVVNEAEWRFHGCAGPDGVVGKRDADFHPPVLADQYVAEDIRVMESGVPLVKQVWLVRGSDGRPKWYSCTKLPVRTADGRVVGVAGIRRLLDHAGTAPGEYARLTPAVEYVLNCYAETISVEQLASLAGLSVSQFQREFRRLFGMAPRQYVAEVRIQAARRALETTAVPLAAVALECGFYDQSYFVKRFKSATGLRPLEYRRRFGRSG